MPHPEAPVASSPPPAQDALAAFLPWLELREVLRKTLQISEVSSALGWPRTLTPAFVERWFAGPHALCTLAHARELEQPLTHLTLPVDQAVALVDVCLGGPGRASVATQAGVPSDAECGVLAYLAARCVRLCAPGLQVRDVSARPASQLRQWPDGAWLLPLRVKLAGQLELTLGLISAPDAPLGQRSITGQLAIGDDLDPARLGPLQPGDLVVCEAWPGQFTHKGPSGVLDLWAPALGASLRVALEAGQVRALHAGEPARRAGRARLVVGEVSASLVELAQLASAGGRLPLCPLQPARLELDGAPLAEGNLVRYRGALALEVGALPSIR